MFRPSMNLSSLKAPIFARKALGITAADRRTGRETYHIWRNASTPLNLLAQALKGNCP